MPSDTIEEIDARLMALFAPYDLGSCYLIPSLELVEIAKLRRKRNKLLGNPHPPRKYTNLSAMLEHLKRINTCQMI